MTNNYSSARAASALKAATLWLALIYLISPTLAVSAAPQAINYGTLSIEDTGTDKICKIHISTAEKYILGDKLNCGFNGIRQIWFENAASAISVSFVKNSAYNDDCKANSISAYPQNITIKTAGSYISTKKFTLNDARTLESGKDIVVPGVRVTHSNFEGTSPSTDVRCLFIAPSPLP
jgi:hypothetical protein